MKSLKIYMAFGLVLAAWLATKNLYRVHAQAPTGTAATLSSNGPHTTCQTPAAGSYFLCIASDGIFVSNNGGPYFQLTAGGAGVTGIAVNGGTLQSGNVNLTIPTAATSVSTATITTSTTLTP
jgi:hypothetical protein